MADINPLKRRMQSLDQQTGNAFSSKKPDAEEESQVKSYTFSAPSHAEDDDAPSGIKAPTGGVQASTGSAKLDALNAVKAKSKAPIKKEPEVYSATE